MSVTGLSTPRPRGSVTRRTGSGSRSTNSDDVSESSGSDLPCSPDDEDCEITFSGGAEVDTGQEAAGMEEREKLQVEEEKVKEAFSTVASAGSFEFIERRTTYDDIVYVYTSTDLTTTTSNKPSQRSRTRTTSASMTSPTRGSSTRPPLEADTRTVAVEELTEPTTTRDLIIITVNMTQNVLSARRRPQTVAPQPVIHTSPPAHHADHTKSAPVEHPTNDQITSREQMARLTLNIGLIVGVAGGLALLFLVLACAVYKYRGGAVGRGGGVKAGSSSGTAPCIKGYVYESCNTIPPSSPTPLTGIPAGQFRTLPASSVGGGYHYPGGQVDASMCATTGRRRDVKEWYV